MTDNEIKKMLQAEKYAEMYEKAERRIRLAVTPLAVVGMTAVVWLIGVM